MEIVSSVSPEANVAVPVVAVAFATLEITAWLPGIVIWCSKPWLDRTILFVLSRAAFGQATTPRDVVAAQRRVWWNQLLMTWTLQRLSPWRSLTGPVYQLEGVSFWSARARVRQIRKRYAGPAAMMMMAFTTAETALVASAASLIFWLAPAGSAPDVFDVFTMLSNEQAGFLAFAVVAAYAMAVVFLEPFYVAVGFSLYLNRRAELEAWDIEQEFRRAFDR